MNQVLELKTILSETQARTTASFVQWYYLKALEEQTIIKVKRMVNFDLNKDPKKLDNFEIAELEKALRKATGRKIK